MKAVDKLLAIAAAEVGYLEKATNKQLDDKRANAGDNNFTKYARDLYPSLQGQAWCDMFVDWCFVQAFGNTPAKQLLCGGFSAYTPEAQRFTNLRGSITEAIRNRAIRYSFSTTPGFTIPESSTE